MKITFDKDSKISIHNPYFRVALNELNIALQGVVSEMVEKDLSSGTITLKIDVNTAKLVVDDDNAQMGTRPAMSIEIGAKVAYVLQSKGEAKADVVSRGDQRELVIDDEGTYYIVSKDEASGQLSMFNSWDEYKEAITE